MPYHPLVFHRLKICFEIKKQACLLVIYLWPFSWAMRKAVPRPISSLILQFLEVVHIPLSGDIPTKGGCCTELSTTINHTWKLKSNSKQPSCQKCVASMQLRKKSWNPKWQPRAGYDSRLMVNFNNNNSGEFWLKLGIFLLFFIYNAAVWSASIEL